MSAAAGAAVAAAAAAERQRQLAEEEEEMTDYGPQALAEDWEFKILRSVQGLFKDPQKLAQFLEEEARAGWMLVEKFDDTRIRLKRPAMAKKNDATLNFDPYRIHVGMPPNAHALLVVGISVAVAVAIMAILVAVISGFK